MSFSCVMKALNVELMNLVALTLQILSASRLTFRHILQTSPQHTCNSLSHAPCCAVFQAFRNNNRRSI